MNGTFLWFHSGAPVRLARMSTRQKTTTWNPRNGWMRMMSSVWRPMMWRTCPSWKSLLGAVKDFSDAFWMGNMGGCGEKMWESDVWVLKLKLGCGNNGDLQMDLKIVQDDHFLDETIWNWWSLTERKEVMVTSLHLFRDWQGNKLYDVWLQFHHQVSSMVHELSGS